MGFFPFGRLGSWFRASRRGLASVALLAFAGCGGPGAMKKDCLEGELSACDAACAGGIAGEGGCFHAGERRRARGGLDFASADWKKAAEYFQKSCNGRHAEGCLFAAQTIEAPFAPPDGAGTAEPKLIGDADVVLREGWLGKACDLGLGAGCKRLGDALLGKNRDKAFAAYEKACRAGAKASECLAARRSEVDTAERWRIGCTNHVADDCTRLGDLLQGVDPPRAHRLFASECGLRGVEALAGGKAAFIKERIRRAKPGLAAPAPPRVPLPPDSPRVTVARPVVTGGVAMVEVDRQLRRYEQDMASCMVGATREGTIQLRLIVDRTGDVWRADITKSDLSGAASTCVAAVLEGVGFTPPATGTATVEVTLTVGAASAAVPAPEPGALRSDDR